jgi:predicted nucleotidyltransferase
MIRSEPLDLLLAAGKIPEEEIIGAFVFGSRAFGTASTTSDYDVYVVVRFFTYHFLPKIGA